MLMQKSNEPVYEDLAKNTRRNMLDSPNSDLRVDQVFQSFETNPAQETLSPPVNLGEMKDQVLRIILLNGSKNETKPENQTNAQKYNQAKLALQVESMLDEVDSKLFKMTQV